MLVHAAHPHEEEREAGRAQLGPVAQRVRLRRVGALLQLESDAAAWEARVRGPDAPPEARRKADDEWTPSRAEVEMAVQRLRTAALDLAAGVGSRLPAAAVAAQVGSEGAAAAPSADPAAAPLPDLRAILRPSDPASGVRLDLFFRWAHDRFEQGFERGLTVPLLQAYLSLLQLLLKKVQLSSKSNQLINTEVTLKLETANQTLGMIQDLMETADVVLHK